jgi:hypothetical protein
MTYNIIIMQLDETSAKTVGKWFLTVFIAIIY